MTNFRLEPEEEPFRSRLATLLVDELYARGLSAVVALLFVLPIMRLVLMPTWGKNRAIGVVFTLLLILVVLRVLFLLAVRRAGGSWASPRTRLWAFATGSTLVAVMLAAIHLLAVPILDDAHMALLAVCAAGVNAVGVISMAGSLGVYLCYLLPSLGAFAVAVAARGDVGVARLLLVLVLIFAASLAVMAVQVHLGLKRNLLLGLKLSDLALRDPLTGLRNRRFLEEWMAGEGERILATWKAHAERRRVGAPESVGLIMVDLDHFKSVNDLYGHGAGDKILRQVGAELCGLLRIPDLVIRWGGDEFVLVVPDPERRAVVAVAERLCRSVATTSLLLPGGATLRLTCSVGWALYPFSPECPAALTWRDVLDLSDAALRVAKSAGRSRVFGLLPGARFDAEPRGAKHLVEAEPEKAQAAGLAVLLDHAAGPVDLGVPTAGEQRATDSEPEEAEWHAPATRLGGPH